MARVRWVEGKTFLGIDDNGRSAVMSSGADGPGVSPMQMLLLGLGGCSMVDLVGILQKQRQPFVSVEAEIKGVRGAEQPRPWEQITLHFIITGEGLDADKVARAVDLAVERYCGVHATLKGVANITHDFEIRQPGAESA
jgi:putative redox protein